MSIQISVKTSGLNITANLKDTALAAIVALIQDNRDDSVATPAPSPMSPVADAALGGSPNLETEGAVKAVLREHGAAEIMTQLRWDSYPEKILLLAAWHEARGGESPWRSATMEDVFTQQAKEKPPGNFPRDIRQCIRSGWIHAATPRTYIVTRTGWAKIGQALSTKGQDETP